MFFYLKSQFRTFFTIISQTFGMSKSGFEFGGGTQMNVDEYRNVLLLQYKVDNDDGRMKSTIVTELHHYKQMSKNSEHEYVVARIMAPDRSITYISFERERGERGDPQSAKVHNSHSQQPPPSPSPSSDKMQTHTNVDSHSQQPPSPSSDKVPVTNFRQQSRSILSPSSSSSLDSLRKHNARDVMRVLDKHKQENDDVSVGNLTFKDDCPLHLYKLATLVVTLHECKLSYALLSNNCYWFAGLLIKVLENCFQVEFEPATPPQPKPGWWKDFKIYTPREGEVEKVSEDFNKSVKSFEEKVKEGHIPKEETRRLMVKSKEDANKFSQLAAKEEATRRENEALKRLVRELGGQCQTHN